MELDNKARLERDVQCHIQYPRARVKRDFVGGDGLPVERYAFGGALRVREPHARHVHARRVSVPTPHVEPTLVERERDARVGLRGDRHAVVEVERTVRAAVRERRRDDELEVGLAEQRGRVLAARAERQDGAAHDRDGDRGEVDVRELYGAAAPAGRRREGVEVVEELVGVVHAHACGVRVDDGGDEDGGPEEELRVDREGVVVLREGEPEGTEDGRPVLLRLVERGVEVVDEAVARVEGVSSRLRGRRPAIELLADGR